MLILYFCGLAINFCFSSCLKITYSILVYFDLALEMNTVVHIPTGYSGLIADGAASCV